VLQIAVKLVINVSGVYGLFQNHDAVGLMHFCKLGRLFLCFLFTVTITCCFGWQYGNNHCDRSDIHLYYSRSMLNDPWAGLTPVPVSRH